MSEGDEPRPFEFRLPVSDGYWREYGVPLGFVLAAFSLVAVVVARETSDGVVVGLTFVGLSAGAVVAGLVVYNLVVAALVAAKR